MASERGLRAGVIAAAAGLAALGACAVSVTESPRLLVVCGLGAVAAGALGPMARLVSLMAERSRTRASGR